MLVDVAFLLILAGTAALVARGGAMRAGVFLLVVTFSGLLAMNWFELLSTSLTAPLDEGSSLRHYGDFAAMLILFASGVFVLRFAVNQVLPESGDLPSMLERPGRWFLGAFAGYVTAAFLLAAVHTFPGSRDFDGHFAPNPAERSGVILKQWAPDYRWLGFTQHISARVFPYAEEGRVFDGPTMTAGENTGRWPTFPLRYARWRESLNQ